MFEREPEPMVSELDGKAIWLSTRAFQQELVPRPHSDLMLSQTKIDDLKERLKVMVNSVPERAGLEKRKEEHVLAEGFTDIINECALDVLKGLRVTLTEGSPDATPASVPASSASSILHDPPRPLRAVSLSEFVPAYVMKVSYHTYDKNDSGQNKVDAAIYPKGATLTDGVPNWAHQRFFVEFRTGKTEDDPFDEHENHPAQADTKDRVRARGQILAYADRVFAYQHRTAVFSFIILGSKFRCMRWDRSGVFVTPKIDYLQDTKTLVELLLGLMILDDESQGVDTTATLLDEDSEDYREMDRLADGSQPFPIPVLSHAQDTLLPDGLEVEAVPISYIPDGDSTDGPSDASRKSPPSGSEPYDYSRSPSPELPRFAYKPKDGSFVFDYELEYFVRSIKKPWPRYRITVGSEEFLVGRPLAEGLGLIGRGTRGYVAWHKQSRTFVFLKDAWHPYYRGVTQEADVLKQLNDADVPNVPTLVCAAHVQQQTTLVSDYWLNGDGKTNKERKLEEKEANSTSQGVKRSRDVPDKEPRSPIRHFGHFRMVVKEVCLPITAVTNSYELVAIVFHCVQAHAAAVEICRIIHHDISSGNILVLPRFVEYEDGSLIVVWYGILTDWELSKSTAAPLAPNPTARRPNRTGTWRYMSVASLLERAHAVEVADEIESFVNVILYNAIRFLPFQHSRTRAELIERYFIKSTKLQDGSIVCGDDKANVMTNGTLKFSNEMLVFGVPGVPDEPLNNLLEAMLDLFRARYEVRAYKKLEADAKQATSGTVTAPSCTPKPPTYPLAKGAAKHRSSKGSRTKPTRFEWRKAEARTSKLKPPSKETVQKAKKLETHAETLDIFDDVLSQIDRWPTHWLFDINADLSFSSPFINNVPPPPYAYVASMSSYCGTDSTGHTDSPSERVFPMIESASDNRKAKKLRIATGTISESFRSMSGSSPSVSGHTSSIE